MTALVPLTTRLRMARLAVVLLPEVAVPEAADVAAQGADLLIFCRGRRGNEETAEAIQVARNRLFGLGTLVAADDLAVGLASGADVVFLRRPGWRPFGYPRPHQFSIFGRSIEGAGEVDELQGEPFVFGFVGPAVTRAGVNESIAEMAAMVPPLGLPSGPVWFAAGGVSRANVAGVLAAGARRVTVSTAIFEAADPFAETRAIADAVRAAWAEDPAAEAYARDAFG